MHGLRPGLIVGLIFLAVFAASYAYLRLNPATTPDMSAPESTAAVPPLSSAPGAPLQPVPTLPPPPAPAASSAEEFAPAAEPPPAMATAPDAVPENTQLAGGGAAPEELPPAASNEAPPAGVPMAPSSTPRATSAMPPAAAADPPAASVPSGDKVLSYFQRTKTQIDTRNAFGFVLLPRAAVTAEEKQTQKQFCETVLATMDFMTPGAIAVETHAILVTYWPINASRNAFEVNTAFAARDCDELLAWYDHKLARSLATRAGVAGLSGPLLITWPSSGAGEENRNPLIVDFSKATHERTTKALQYWFRQLRNKPDLWTNRIREGTIRAELADAVNDTAGVVLAVLYGKWDSLNAVSASATP